MAFGDVVQSIENSGASGGASATLAGGATAGNLLIFNVSRSSAHSAGGAWGTPSGFTDLPQSPINSGNMASAGWAKIATGGETAISVTGTNENGNWRATVSEYEGPFTSVTPDKTAESEANISSVVTSQTSGTTGTTTQNDALAIAYFGADNATNVDGTRAYSNSFTEVLFADDVSSAARAAIMVARKVLSATGTVETTFSCTDTGDEMYGAVAVFLKQVASGQPAARRTGLIDFIRELLGLEGVRIF